MDSSVQNTTNPLLGPSLPRSDQGVRAELDSHLGTEWNFIRICTKEGDLQLS